MIKDDLDGLEAVTETQTDKFDMEWVALILVAKDAGLTVADIQQFLKERSSAMITNDMFFAKTAD